MPNPIMTRLKNLLVNRQRGPGLYIFNGTDVTTASAATYTAAAVFGGYIFRDPSGSSRTDTLPTAALMIEYLRASARDLGVQLERYVAFDFIVENRADAAETITVQSGSGGTDASGYTFTIAQNYSKRFTLIFDTVAETYALRAAGTFLT